jgi:predicted acylesterase/phospholipase RssA
MPKSEKAEEDASSGWDYRSLPDWDDDFYCEDDILAFASALSAPETSPSEEDLLNPKRQSVEFITALNDWAPVRQTVRGRERSIYGQTDKKRRRKRRRGTDETREGFSYTLTKWPLLFIVLGWLAVESALYGLTRFYIVAYERYIAWRGKKDRLRKSLRKQTTYEGWTEAAKELDKFLGNDDWKVEDEYAYYDDRTIRRVMEQMRRSRYQAEQDEKKRNNGVHSQRPIDHLVELAKSCVKNNFAGSENPRLYSETYYGTKNLVQAYVDEVSASLKFLFGSSQLTQEDKRNLSRHLSTNFGRTALCLSGGASFAWYHFGIAKALLDAGLLPNIITGTSGGALVATLLATRTDEELKQLLVPALAHRITACHDPMRVWFWRWWRTGARFDAVDWAKRCAWFTRGSMTFLEAYERTGRILNITCIPSDPHSPTILANYLTAPDCVIWSTVLASAAVPGILNPVVLMRKNRDGKLEPYSFGHKWKDGSLKTDIPLKSLNLHFNVNFSIVSQVNPHINLFFFSSRGTVGRPVTHRRGRGWRGGFLGSAAEQFLKLDMNKWLKVLRHLELLPRPLGQDWSEVWLQRFSGTITIWPRSILSDFYRILSDPSMQQLARMLRVGQLAAWPKLKFISNRMAVERLIQDAREATRPPNAVPAELKRERTLRNVLSEDDLNDLLEKAKNNNGVVEIPLPAPPSVPAQLDATVESKPPQPPPLDLKRANSSRSITKKWSEWFGSKSGPSSPKSARSTETVRPPASSFYSSSRRGSFLSEFKRQSQVFFDDPETSHDEAASEDEPQYGSEVEDNNGVAG